MVDEAVVKAVDKDDTQSPVSVVGNVDIMRQNVMQQWKR